MKSIPNPLSYGLFLLIFLLTGCMTSPFPQRYDSEGDKKADAAWTAFASRRMQMDRQDILDVVLTYSLFFEGSDRMYFRSEKDTPQGMIRIETQFTRKAPQNDAVIIRFFDTTGELVREERYTREEINSTLEAIQDLHEGEELHFEPLAPDQESEPNPPDQEAQARKARQLRIDKNFPVEEDAKETTDSNTLQ